MKKVVMVVILGLLTNLIPLSPLMAQEKVQDKDFKHAEKIKKAGGYRYKQARRPELYRDIIGEPHIAQQKVIWLDPEVSQSKDHVEHKV